jgi:hypothetical protein
MDRLSMQSTDIEVSGIDFRDVSAEVSWVGIGRFFSIGEHRSA